MGRNLFLISWLNLFMTVLNLSVLRNHAHSFLDPMHYPSKSICVLSSTWGNWTVLTSNQIQAEMSGKCTECSLGFLCWYEGYADALLEVFRSMPLIKPLSHVPKGPQCALPFGASSLLNGAVFCENISEQAPSVQQCRLVCRQGFRSASSSTAFQCDVQQRRWVSAAPLHQACQSTSDHGVGRLQSSVNRCAKMSFRHKATVWMTIIGHNSSVGAAAWRHSRLAPSSAIFISVSWLAPMPETVPLFCNNIAINSYSIYMQIFLCKLKDADHEVILMEPLSPGRTDADQMFEFGRTWLFICIFKSLLLLHLFAAVCSLGLLLSL